MKLVVTITLLICSSVGLGNQRQIIHAGHLIDGVSNQARERVSIHIEGSRITKVQSGYQSPASGEQLIDLRDSYILPGLMDMHTHVSFEFGPKTYLEKYTLNPADYTIMALKNSEKTLMAGFTTIRDLGDTGNITVAVREAINKGLYPGPRIFTATKSIATTGGHADPSNGNRLTDMHDLGAARGVINSATEARKAVRQRYKEGADLIKITATGGVLSVAKSGQNPQFQKDELDAIVKTAQDYGFTVAVHAHGKEGMKRAILAGVDSIEHGTYMDQEIMKLMKQKGTYYVPTILAGHWVAEKSKISGFFPDLVRPKAAQIGPLILTTFSKAYHFGVKIAYGTDSGVSSHGDNWQEFGLMVKGGMSPMEAIQSATIHAAKLLKQEDSLGSIESKKIADIVATKDNPLKDINAMGQIHFVMKEGRIYKNNNRSLQVSH
ncbi:metal-dependent hydrolase family protein [Pseudobacteriovorax antillogorgiicola]|uniref:Imidazolonepropionase n=1 Tax=Pseudobacteriovorax antillogorgiicola TaxID=1513793 RepID=A0A1Y6BK59_9BACT|nr:amidohydrolase family protein [Pseudobacteriovorax antillogorgiicola]TCS56448.1 imidazolonepropionase-like amidohydrolase [Pseudobacteriovorax antillogorgiicola]SMF05331.1 Imidazolonepropionase [Pseudobacteriovorax antillogorgiicola]